MSTTQAAAAPAPATGGGGDDERYVQMCSITRCTVQGSFLFFDCVQSNQVWLAEIGHVEIKGVTAAVPQAAAAAAAKLRAISLSWLITGIQRHRRQRPQQQRRQSDRQNCANFNRDNFNFWVYENLSRANSIQHKRKLFSQLPQMLQMSSTRLHVLSQRFFFF